MTPEHLQTNINLFMYCIANETTPAGGLKFQSLFEDYELDGTTQSLFRLDKLLFYVRGGNTLSELLSTDDGKNFIKAIAIYIGCYLSYQLEDYAEDISWQDTYDILSQQKVQEDSILWFTSVKLIIDQHSYKPVYQLKEFFENPDKPSISKDVFNFLSKTHDDIIKTQTRKKERIAKEKLKTEQVLNEHVSKENTSPSATHTDISINDMHQNPEFKTNTVTDYALKTIDENNEESKAAELNFFELQQLLETQKKDIKATQTNALPNSSFAKAFKNPFAKKSLPKYSAHLDDTNKDDFADIVTQPKKVQDEYAYNAQSSQTTAKKPKLDTETSAKQAPEKEQQKQPETKTQNLMMVQLLSDKYNPAYVLSNETNVLPELAKYDDEINYLKTQAENNHVHAIFILGCTQLENVKNNHEVDFSLPFEIEQHSASIQQELKDSIDLLTKAAEKDNAAAQYFLAMAFEKGFIVDKNQTTSETWLKAAAKNKHPKAIQTLANNTKNNLSPEPFVSSLSKVDDQIILWVVGILSFAIGMLFLF